MLVEQLIQSDFPTLHLSDKVSFALQLMDEYDSIYLPVIENNLFNGIIAKSSLLDTDEEATLLELQEQFIQVSVKKEEYFLSTLKLFVEKKISIVPVVNIVNEYIGLVSTKTLLENVYAFLGTNEPGAVIVLEVERRNYSFGEISRLIETNDAYITQLNTYTETATGLVIVCIKVNKLEISDIISTFNRYDYVVRYYFGEEQYANELRANYNHLMSYLNI